MLPILPLIGDNDEDLDTLVKMVAEHHAQYALVAGLTLKPGNREEFLTVLKRHYPQTLATYYEVFQACVELKRKCTISQEFLRKISRKSSNAVKMPLML